MARDMRDDQLLIQMGWTPIHFWEKEVMKNLSACIAEIEDMVLTQIVDSVEELEPLNQEE